MATAVLYRMQTPEHVCPFGLKSRWLLRREGYEVDDHTLESRAETDAFQREYGVDTTPQTFIDGVRVGGYDDLRERFGLDDDEAAPSEDEDEATTYQPVVAVFAVSALVAVAAGYGLLGTLASVRVLELFAAVSMTVLAILKLRDLEAFTNQFLGYDLLAQRWVPYAYAYPFAEAFAGLGMIAGGPFVWAAAPVGIFVGSVGAVSVVKAVYVEHRELKCACVGGNSNVPLGAISLTENLTMVAMGVWMIVKASLGLG